VQRRIEKEEICKFILMCAKKDREGRNM